MRQEILILTALSMLFVFFMTLVITSHLESMKEMDYENLTPTEKIENFKKKTIW